MASLRGQAQVLRRAFAGRAGAHTLAIARVPRWMWALVGGALLCRLMVPAPVTLLPEAPKTRPPPVMSASWLTILAGGDRALVASVGMLWLQAIDQPPGRSVGFAKLDYAHLVDWLTRLLDFRPTAAYPLLAGIRVYGEVADPERQRQMIAFTREAFREAPARRWRWQAHAVFVASHRLRDPALAFALADELAASVRSLPNIPPWARQLDIFVRAGLGEREAAAVLLGALLDSGQVTDAGELAFLRGRLTELSGAESRPRTTAPPNAGAARSVEISTP